MKLRAINSALPKQHSVLHRGVPTSLGCVNCRLLEECGGLQREEALFDCLENCCGKPDQCEHVVCPTKTLEFFERCQEVSGFKLDVSLAQLDCPSFPSYVPMVDSASLRSENIDYAVVAIKVTAPKRGKSDNGQSLRERLLLSPSTKLLLSSVDHDSAVERMWPWITSNSFADYLAAVEPIAMWTPNFSLFADAPRTNDLHSLKRIALCAERISQCGISPIVHVHGRMPRDYERWIEMLNREPAHLIGFEFASIPANKKRFHASMLVRIAEGVSRPLTLLVRGGRRYLPRLSRAFDSVIVVDPQPLIWARNRKRVIRQNGSITTKSGWTLVDQLVDHLVHENIREFAEYYTSLVSHGRVAQAEEIRSRTQNDRYPIHVRR